MAAQAQPETNWQVLLNKTLLLRATAQTADPVLKIPIKSLNGKKMITIKYNTAEGNSDWNRTFNINDEGENNIKELKLPRQSGMVSFDARILKKYADKGKPLFIYTISLPKDPEQAAVVRVRRTLVAKIVWQ
jgi:hypothetical protein